MKNAVGRREVESPPREGGERGGAMKRICKKVSVVPAIILFWSEAHALPCTSQIELNACLSHDPRPVFFLGYQVQLRQ